MIPRQQRIDASFGTGWRLLTLAGAATVLSEIVHWWASQQRLGLPRTTQPHSEVVLVLGHPSRHAGRPHLLQRWRTEIAVRSLDPQRRNSRLVFSGADPRGGRSEAAVMAAYARDVLGVPSERIVLEERARSTWENVAFSLSHLEGAEAIKIASDPLHAFKARRYLWEQSQAWEHGWCGRRTTACWSVGG